MQTIRVRSWSGFSNALKKVHQAYGIYRRNFQDGSSFERSIPILYRGQANARWDLLTTLERKTEVEFDVLSYVEVATRTINELESFTGQRWKLPVYPEFYLEIKTSQDSFKVHIPVSIYSYLVYLRHHGYPSPLLDWTDSPYIAAYFAYINSGNENPAVYCYIERPNLAKGGVGGEPKITLTGRFVSTHKRHFAQKASYTISTRWDYATQRHKFCRHELVFNDIYDTQDVLIKIQLPAKERLTALRSLSEFNIDHFTLFQSEDALVKALEIKNFDLREPDV